MVEVEDAIVEILSGNSGVTDLVGEDIFGVHWPQKPPSPAILVQVISDVSGAHLRGQSPVSFARVQIDVLAAELESDDAKETANAVMAAVDAALLSKAPFQAGGSPPTIQVEVVAQIDRRVMYEGEEQFRTVVVQQDYRVANAPL